MTKMKLELAKVNEFEDVREFYYRVIDLLQSRSDTVAWKKGVYPSDEFMLDSIKREELYVMKSDNRIVATIIANSNASEGYEGLNWSVECIDDEVLIPHALAVDPRLHKQGIGKMVVMDIMRIAKEDGKKTIRLDILNGNNAAIKLYTSVGFKYIATKQMYYEDTGWTDFLMYDYVL